MRVMSEEKLVELEDYIKRYVNNHSGNSPKLREIAAFLGCAKSTALRYVEELEKRGKVAYSGKNTLEIPGQERLRTGFVRLPVLGEIVCGSPNEQEQYIEGYVAIPEAWARGECFLLRTYGDSMTDLGIDEGDLVLVRRTSEAYDGQVVVALTENGNTLKRYFSSNGKPRLHAENKTYKHPDIYPEELTIQGVALKLIKDIV